MTSSYVPIGFRPRRAIRRHTSAPSRRNHPSRARINRLLQVGRVRDFRKVRAFCRPPAEGFGKKFGACDRGHAAFISNLDHDRDPPTRCGAPSALKNGLICPLTGGRSEAEDPSLPGRPVAERRTPSEFPMRTRGDPVVTGRYIGLERSSGKGAKKISQRAASQPYGYPPPPHRKDRRIRANGFCRLFRNALQFCHWGRA